MAVSSVQVQSTTLVTVSRDSGFHPHYGGLIALAPARAARFMITEQRRNRLLQELAGDDHALDLVGALVDLGDLRGA